ncbi:trans-Golgi network integral membrane protein 2-like [Diachasmimorpha longicaudata]|uniref:trans-Golgi network integral membrane protein 2-like n=1 Tax=Diachasmimorpha longicaudata TaxID=58733 RepID=UPI0030B8E490
MIFKALIILCLLVFQCSKSSGAALAPTILAVMNADMQSNSSNICSTAKEILDSEYVKACNNLAFPAKNAKLEGNYDTFLCLALYDRAFQICHADSRGLEIPILKNKSAFDQLITDDIKNSTIFSVCETFATISPATLEKTKSFVEILSARLKLGVPCVGICAKGDREINPLCLVIQAIDTEIKKAEENKKNEEQKTKEGKVDDVQGSMKGMNASKPVAPVANPQENEKPSGGDKVGTGSALSKDQSAAADSQNAGVKPVETKPDEKTKPASSQVKDQSANNEKKTAGEHQGSPSQTQHTSAASAKGKTEGPKTDDKSKSQVTPSGQVQTEKPASTLSANTGEGEGVQLEGDEEFKGGPQEVSPGDMEFNEDEDPTHQNSGKTQGKNVDRSDQSENIAKPLSITPDDDSHFFGYFMLVGLVGIGLFAAYHHKHKIFAMLLEGRKSRGGRGRRRPSTANYRKLDCTLEEAVTSQCSSNVTHVIY